MLSSRSVLNVRSGEARDMFPSRQELKGAMMDIAEHVRWDTCWPAFDRYIDIGRFRGALQRFACVSQTACVLRWQRSGCGPVGERRPGPGPDIGMRMTSLICRKWTKSKSLARGSADGRGPWSLGTLNMFLWGMTAS